MSSPALARVVGANMTDLKWGLMRMPNCRGWPEELGGRWVPDALGEQAHAFLDQLRADCPESQCPLWPDPYDPQQAEVADAIPQEKRAFFPWWFVSGLGTLHGLQCCVRYAVCMFAAARHALHVFMHACMNDACMHSCIHACVVAHRGVFCTCPPLYVPHLVSSAPAGVWTHTHGGRDC